MRLVIMHGTDEIAVEDLLWPGIDTVEEQLVNLQAQLVHQRHQLVLDLEEDDDPAGY